MVASTFSLRPGRGAKWSGEEEAGTSECSTTIEAGVARFPPTFICHNAADDVVPIVNSQRLDKLLGTVEHEFLTCTDGDPEFGHHPFIEDDPQDKDSRKKAMDWILKHLKPGGK